MAILFLSITVIAVCVVLMSVGVLLSGRCLRGSCGGPDVLGPDGRVPQLRHLSAATGTGGHLIATGGGPERPIQVTHHGEGAAVLPAGCLHEASTRPDSTSTGPTAGWNNFSDSLQHEGTTGLEKQQTRPADRRAPRGGRGRGHGSSLPFDPSSETAPQTPPSSTSAAREAPESRLWRSIWRRSSASTGSTRPTRCVRSCGWCLPRRSFRLCTSRATRPPLTQRASSRPAPATPRLQPSKSRPPGYVSACGRSSNERSRRT